MASLFNGGRFQGFDSAGIPLSGGFLYTYAAGTLTPLATYTTQSGGVANANPVVLDSAGRAPVWLSASSYRMVLKTAGGVTVTDDDNISPYPGDTVTFIAAGSGAVTRTMQDKGRESISVADFGVTGSGSDESTELAAAITAMGSGGTLSLGGLTITIDARIVISALSGFTIDGEGGTIIALNGMTVASDKELLTFRACTDFTLKNLTVDGNRANRTPSEVAAHNIEFRSCARFLVERVKSINAVVDGFIFNTATNTDAATYCRDFEVRNCLADNCYRQGASVINAYDYTIRRSTFTSTNGTAPAAGLDIESNTGAVMGTARSVVEQCRFEGNDGFGVLVSNVAGTQDVLIVDCYFSANDLGGCATYAPNTHITRSTFRSHSGAGVTQGVVVFANTSAVTSGSATNNRFVGNTNTTAAIYTGGSSSNILISDNIIDSHSGSAISISGTGHTVSLNRILSCAGIGVVSVGVDTIVTGNRISAATGRGIYFAGGSGGQITHNIVKDTATVSGGFIQCDINDVLISANKCSAAAPSSDIGVYIGSGGTALTVCFNVCTNLNTTDPYSFTTSSNDELVFGNIGGSFNDRRAVRRGMAVPSFSTAGRPAATDVAQGQQIFNTTTSKPNWSTGTAWVDATGTVV